MAKIIEFTGVPEAGKTTVIYKLKEALGDYRVKIIDEATTKMKKDLPDDAKNKVTYIVADIIKEYVAAINGDYDYILIDRGLYDRYFWNYFSYMNGDIGEEEKQSRDLFVLHEFINYQVDLLIVFLVDGEEAVRRRGSEGRFVTKEKMNFYGKLLQDFCQDFNETKVVQVTTTNKNVVEVTDEVLQKLV